MCADSEPTFEVRCTPPGRWRSPTLVARYLLTVWLYGRHLRPCGRWAAQLRTRGHGAVRSAAQVGRGSRQLVRRDALCGVSGIRCPCLASVGARPHSLRGSCAPRLLSPCLPTAYSRRGGLRRGAAGSVPFCLFANTACCTHISEYPYLWVVLAYGARCAPHAYNAKQLSCMTPIGIIDIDAEFEAA